MLVVWAVTPVRHVVRLPSRSSQIRLHVLHYVHGTTSLNDDKSFNYFFYIATCTPNARHRLGKHIPSGANAPNNMTSIARQQNSKHVSLTTETALSIYSVPRIY
jgi:hypothetical protein